MNIKNSNHNDHLVTLAAYKSKILTDKQQIEKMLVREIQLACDCNGYRLVEIKIEKL